MISKNLENLKTNAWRTSSSRYNAARRLQRRESFANFSLALMSAMTIAMAFVQRIYAIDTPADDYLTTVIATLGIFLLTVSLLQWGVGNGAVAEALHLNAERLNGFRRRVGLKIDAQEISPLSLDDVERFNAEYENIKNECQHNHIPLDDKYFRIHHLDAEEFLHGKSAPAMGKWDVIKIKLHWWLSNVGYVLLIWIFLIFLIIPLFFPTMWQHLNAGIPISGE